MAEDVRSVREAPLVTERRRTQALRPYETRFSVLYVFLAAIVAAAVVALAIVLKEGDSSTKGQWSSWKPTDSGIAGAKQIAEHVSGRYRLNSGNQAAAVLVEPHDVSNIPLSYIVVRNGNDIENDQVIPYEEAVPYTICGLGAKCALAEGTPSQQRMRLIRRQAIELALYTFRYQKGVKSVITYLPPSAGADPDAVLLFRRSDLQPSLDRPLQSTLIPRKPLTPETIKPDNRLIDAITRNRVFRFKFQQIPNGSAIVVLAPPEL
jgi:hypothetical protein